jgi:outer membrane biosynthesis protein TonB
VPHASISNENEIWNWGDKTKNIHKKFKIKIHNRDEYDKYLSKYWMDKLTFKQDIVDDEFEEDLNIAFNTKFKHLRDIYDLEGKEAPLTVLAKKVNKEQKKEPAKEVPKERNSLLEDQRSEAPKEPAKAPAKKKEVPKEPAKEAPVIVSSPIVFEEHLPNYGFKSPMTNLRKWKFATDKKNKNKYYINATRSKSANKNNYYMPVKNRI